MSLFKAFGRFKIRRVGNIIEIRALGNWSEGVSQQVMTEVTKLRAEIPQSHFAVVGSVENWVLGTPEMQTFAASAIESLIEQGLSKTAYIIGDKDDRLKMMQLAAMMPKSSNYERQFFANREQAIYWLAQSGFVE